MKQTTKILILSFYFFSPFFAEQKNVEKNLDADFDLILAVTANDVDDTQEALKADGVHVNAKDETNGNPAFAIAAHNFIKAVQEKKKQNKVAAAEIMQRLLENGAKPVTVYYIESPSRGRVKQDMSDNVELQFLIQKYSARRMSV